MRPAILLSLGALCGGLAYGAGYLLVARIAPPVGRTILRRIADLSGHGAAFRLDRKGGAAL